MGCRTAPCRLEELTDSWPSGRRRTPGKCVGGEPSRGFESLTVRHIGYAADWSEYFEHQPGDGSGDVFCHLDPLWADPEIDFIDIDNYMPLSDWRDGFDHLDAAEGSPKIAATQN